MPAASTVLAGVSLATGIAREATDGVPIVKQIIGVASRIVGLAEQIDKDKEDLHELADRAKKIDVAIATVVGDREPGDHLLRRLEDLKAVLRAVEKYLVDHIKQGRVRKTFRSILTVRKDLDRLKAEFERSLKELEVAANLDTNLTTRENSRFIGEFRNIRHCEVHLLHRITTSREDERGPKFNCHLATCDGSNQVFVVRDTVAIPGLDTVEGQRIAGHNRILEEMSLIRNRHPGIARLYGRNTGPGNNRFVVLEAGDILPVRDIVLGSTLDVSVLGGIVAKLLDACCHLLKHGATWVPAEYCAYERIYVDKNYEPTIGIDDDLCTLVNAPGYPAFNIQFIVVGLLEKSGTAWPSQEDDWPHAHLRSTTWFTEMFGALIDAGYQENCQQNVVRRDDISSLIPLNHESQMCIRHPSKSHGYLCAEWGIILLRLAMGAPIREGSFLQVIHHPSWRGEHDIIEVCCIEGTVDAVYNTNTSFSIPTSAATEVKQKLGISEIEDDIEDMDDRDNFKYLKMFYLQRFAGAGGTPMECTGWRRGLPHQKLW